MKPQATKDWCYSRNILRTMAGVDCQAIKNKNHNRSIKEFKKLAYERWLIYKQPRRNLDLCDDSFARYSEKYFTQIYRAL